MRCCLLKKRAELHTGRWGKERQKERESCERERANVAQSLVFVVWRRRLDRFCFRLSASSSLCSINHFPFFSRASEKEAQLGFSLPLGSCPSSIFLGACASESGRASRLLSSRPELEGARLRQGQERERKKKRKSFSFSGKRRRARRAGGEERKKEKKNDGRAAPSAAPERAGGARVLEHQGALGEAS